MEVENQGKDPSTFKGRSHKAERWRVQKNGRKRRRRKKKKKEKEKKKKAKHRKRRWWEKCKEIIISLFVMRTKKAKKEKESKKSKTSQSKTNLGKFGKWLFLFLIMGRIGRSVRAAAEGPQRTEVVMKMQQEVRNKESKMDGDSAEKVEAAQRGRQN